MADRGAVRVKADMRGNDRDETCCRLPPWCQAVGTALCMLLAVFTMLDAALRALLVSFLLKLVREGLHHQPRARRAKACSAGPPLGVEKVVRRADLAN